MIDLSLQKIWISTLDNFNADLLVLLAKLQ